jgi:hypothetical protein
MLILFDQGTPFPLRTYLGGHTVVSAFEKGWSQFENGELISAAEAHGYDVLITTDQNIRYQQTLALRKIAIVVLLTTNWPRIERYASLVIDAVARITPGTFQEISFPDV